MFYYLKENRWDFINNEWSVRGWITIVDTIPVDSWHVRYYVVNSYGVLNEIYIEELELNAVKSWYVRRV